MTICPDYMQDIKSMYHCITFSWDWILGNRGITAVMQKDDASDMT